MVYHYGSKIILSITGIGMVPSIILSSTGIGMVPSIIYLIVQGLSWCLALLYRWINWSVRTQRVFYVHGEVSLGW